MGSKGGSNTTTSQSSSGPPPQVMAEYQGLVDRATNVANQPYQPYQGEMVAPLSNQTLTGLGGINQAAGAAQPYLGAAGAMTMGASAPVNPQQFMGMGSLAPYMNPYTESVVNATQAEMNNQNQQQAQFLNSANISSGAFGGDRAGIGQSILANQQQLAEAPTIAGLNQANYNQAMSNWQNQQGVNLAAQQANAARQMSGAAQLGSIGETMQQAGLQGAQAQIQAGMIPQQQQQAIDTAAQNMYQTQQAYPFTTTGWLGNIIEGTGSLSGGTSQSSTTGPPPNALGQGIGAATQGIGLLGSLMSLSDVRAKENIEEIGKTYDDQPIYRYNFKGDPRTQIGLLAQEEAYHDPGSVQRIGMGDLLGIDYRGATDDAAERGHFADGGMPQGAPMPSGQGVDYDLMMSGDPGARAGLGSTMGILGGTNMHPQPTFDTVPLRPSGQAPGQQRQGFQGGGGLDAMGDITNSYNNGYLNPEAGVANSLYDSITAGSKSPQFGVDLGQIAAIGGGQWMPPVTNSPAPDWQNLQNSPQFGAAEASLSGLFGGSDATSTAPGAMKTPVAIGGAPMPGAAGAAGATAGGLSRSQLGDLANSYFGGGSGGGGGSSGSGGLGSYTPGSVPTGTDTLHQTSAAPAAAQAPAPQPTFGTAEISNNIPISVGRGGMGELWERPTTVLTPGDSPMFGTNNTRGGLSSAATGGRIGGTNVNGRGNFQGGGLPTLNDPRYSYYTPSTGNARGATYHAPLPQPVPPAIQVRRQIQGAPRVQPRAVRPQPRVVAPPPFHQPDHPSTARYPGWPTPGPNAPSASGGPSIPFMPIPHPGEIPPPGAEPPLDETWKTKPYGGRSTPWQGAPPEEAAPPPPGRGVATRTPPLEGDVESPGLGETITRGVTRFLPKLIGRRIPFADFVVPPEKLAPPSMDEAPQWSWPKQLPPPQKQLQLPPPQKAFPPDSSVHDLGTWEGEGGAPAPSVMPGSRWRTPPAVDDPDVMRMGDEGPQLFRGGRIGRADGGDINTSYGPQQPASDMSNAQFGREVQDEMRSSSPSDLDWLDQTVAGLPSDSSWDALAPGGGDRTGRLQLNPGSVASTPTFGGGGGGGGYRGDVTSLMGGPPITAGHFVPTTGNARGATFVPGSGINPNARAQAPEHPAIKIARHIASRAFADGHRAGRVSAGVNLSNYANIIGNHGSWPTPNTDYGSWVPPSEGYLGGENSPSGNPHGDAPPDVPQHFQGGGGVMGSSPLMNAGGYTPQGAGMTGQTSQGEGLGSFATSKAASGFGDLFGGERAGFQEGGGAYAIDPFLAAIQASSGGQGRMGPGPPQPQAPKPPEAAGGGGGNPLGDSLKGLNSVVKQFKDSGGVQTTPTGSDGSAVADPTDASGGWGDMAGTPDFSALPDNTFDLGTDIGFRTGGGVGLGSLRGNFQDGGDPTPDEIDAEVAGAGQPPVAAAPAPARGGGSAAPNLTYFGDRAGYAGTISRLESGSGKNYVGDDGSSFGPFQLHMGGISAKYPHPGLGDEFKAATGLDPRDPSTVDAQSKFVADYTAKHGWAPWSTKGQADRIAGADIPSAGATPAQASTESYGGGFQIPGDPGTPPPSRPPTIGDELRRDPFGYMMTVGAGMMASRSPFLGTMMGEGFAAGNKYLGSMQSLDREWNLNQAQINNLSAEAREHGADANYKVIQIQLAQRAAMIQTQILRQMGFNVGSGADASGSPTGGSGAAPGAIAPLPTIGGGAGPSGAPGGGAGPSGGPPVQTAPTPASGGDGPVDAPAGAAPPGEVPSLSADPRWQEGQKLITQGNQLNAAGSLTGMKDAGAGLIARGNALVEAAKTDWESKKQPILKGQEEAESSGRKAMLENDGDESAARSTRNDIQSKLEQLFELNETMRTSPGMPIQEIISKWGGVFGGNTRTATNAQEFEKLALNEMYKELTSAGLKGQVRNMEISGFMKQMPELVKTPQANRDILLNALGLMDKANAYGDAYMNWRQTGQGRSALTEGPFQYKWNNENSSSSFVNSRFHKYAADHGQPTGVPTTAILEQNPKTKEPRWRDPKTGQKWDWQGNPMR